ncbi:MAG TPA: class I SAM-dependent methyltransferase [archaeon]|nr:class I SAM-dependent methyltransferase [archaeon]
MAEKFYTELAKYYDRFHSYIDYSKESQFILGIIKKYRPDAKTLLDMCCGTGEHAKFLKAYGFEITGVDLNKEMLEIARQKNSELKFFEGGMKNFASKNKFDLIICHFNSILYNKTKKELSQTLSNFYSLLGKGGLLIFDAVGKEIGLNPQRGKFGKGENFIFRPEWTYKENGSKECVEVDIIFEMRIDGKPKKIRDVHILGAFSLDEIKSSAERAGFQAEIFRPDKTPLEKIPGNSWKGVFVCRKG